MNNKTSFITLVVRRLTHGVYQFKHRSNKDNDLRAYFLPHHRTACPIVNRDSMMGKLYFFISEAIPHMMVLCQAPFLPLILTLIVTITVHLSVSALPVRPV